MCQLNLELTSLFQIQNQKQSNPKLNPKTESPFSVSNPAQPWSRHVRRHDRYCGSTISHVYPAADVYVRAAGESGLCRNMPQELLAAPAAGLDRFVSLAQTPSPHA